MSIETESTLDRVHTRYATSATVRPDLRLVDVLAVPYNVETRVRDADGDYVETIDPGAFTDAPARLSKVKVLRDHNAERVIGRVHGLYPNKPTGLEATLRISATPLGDETLALIDDEVLAVSVGFLPVSTQWDRDRSAARRMRVVLYEISFVPFPAYADAVVNASRGASTTPRRDHALAGWLELSEQARQLRAETKQVLAH